MVGGLISIIYTLPKMTPWWKPLYWLGIPLASLPVIIVVLVFIEDVFNIEFIPGSTLVVMLKVTLFILGLELIAVPAIHRLEIREFSKLAPPHIEDRREA